jgi:hypothetical protein
METTSPKPDTALAKMVMMVSTTTRMNLVRRRADRMAKSEHSVQTSLSQQPDQSWESAPKPCQWSVALAVIDADNGNDVTTTNKGATTQVKNCASPSRAMSLPAPPSSYSHRSCRRLVSLSSHRSNHGTDASNTTEGSTTISPPKSYCSRRWSGRRYGRLIQLQAIVIEDVLAQLAIHVGCDFDKLEGIFPTATTPI